MLSSLILTFLLLISGLFYTQTCFEWTWVLFRDKNGDIYDINGGEIKPLRAETALRVSVCVVMNIEDSLLRAAV